MKNKEEIKFILLLGIVSILIFFIFHSSTTNATTTNYNINNAPFGSALAKASPGNLIKEAGSNALNAVFIWLLTGILTFVGWLLSAAISIFTWTVDVNVFKAILSNNSAIYETWKVVRDIFNIAFILVLLFSAFATIFQVEKYNYKKILFTVVLMALLVNFSFPIARFIIDVSNSLMYTLIKELKINPEGANASVNIFARFSEYANAHKILGGDTSGDIPTLLASIIFLFILMITFMVMAVLFLIRVIALAIIVIFSPIAFVGAILPGGLGSGKWWDYLFKYSFFGPAMVFMIFVAQRMMTATSETYLPILQATQTNTTAGNLVAPMAIFAIPVVILWIGMGVANSMSIAGASTVTSGAKKWGKWLAQRPQKAAWWGTKKAAKKVDRDYIGIQGFMKAWKDRSTEVEANKVGAHAATARDLLGSIFDRGKRPSTFYRDVEDANQIAKFKKEQDLYSTTDVDIMAAIDKLKKGKQTREAGQRIQAFLQTMAGNKDLNEFEKLQGRGFDPDAAKENIYNLLKSTSGERGAVEALHDLEDINLVNGVYSLFGLTHSLTKEDIKAGDKRGSVVGQRVKSNSEEQISASLAKMKQVDYQKFMINFHRDTAILESADGKPIGLSKIGVKALEFIETQGGKYADRWRGENKEAILTAIGEHYKKTGDDITARLPELMKALGVKKGDSSSSIPAGEARPSGTTEFDPSTGKWT
jgi:hypothetical protein